MKYSAVYTNYDESVVYVIIPFALYSTRVLSVMLHVLRDIWIFCFETI